MLPVVGAAGTIKEHGCCLIIAAAGACPDDAKQNVCAFLFVGDPPPRRADASLLVLSWWLGGSTYNLDKKKVSPKTDGIVGCAAARL